MRDGTPLPGLTPAHVVSQLAYRVFGPRDPGRTRIVLDYHGLLDRPAATLVVIADRHQVTTRTVSNNVATVRAAGTRQPLSVPLSAEATRASAPVEDHLGRCRVAATLGLPVPPAAPVDEPAAADPMPRDQVAAGRIGMRVIAAVGPVELPVLAGAVARSRRFRARKPLSDIDFTAALTRLGCTVDPADRWHPPAGRWVPSDRYRVIVTLAAGRDLTRRQMIDILITAGYQPSSAVGRMSTSHPLFHRTGPDRYRLLGDLAPVGGSSAGNRPGDSP